ncbi:MAG: alpha/beta fold hydrolase [Wenzhouxiangella sp.]|nr:alpha/beta fold hydrolase [Wenzhouxiangella sp.]
MNDSSNVPLQTVVVETGASPAHAVIWLHGLGADGHDFEPIVPHLTAAARRPVRFIFPHAPVRPVTINGGMAMRAWYDILGMQIDRDQDPAGIPCSVAAVNPLLEQQSAAGIRSDRIVLAGFSQGGAIALRCGLARVPALAGVMALSCYLLDGARLADWAAPEARSTPVFMAHGDHDPIVPVALGAAAARQLDQAGYSVHWQTWPMPHSLCAEEIQAIDRWLQSIWA